MKFRLEFGVVLAVCILGLLPNLAFAASPSCPALSANLAQGSTGPEVTALQEYLAEYPTVYPQGIISAYYGSLTTAAVERFQATHGIVSSGSPYTTGYGALGPRTRAAIESSCGTPPPPPPQNSCPTFIEPLGPGSTGEGVSTLQSFLGRFPALYPEDLTSGYYGSLTTAAVERFQTLENIVSSGSPYTTGYGAVGPRTAAALATYCAETTVSTSTPEGNNASGSGGGGGGGGTQGGGQEDTIPPSVPQNLQASPTEGQVFLSWSPSTDNVGVQGYYVYRDGAEIANVGGTVYTDPNVTDGDTYTYTVAAYDYSGNVSSQSTPVQTTVPSGGGGGEAPSAPTNLTASSTVDTVSLSWDASTGGEGGVAGYQIYRNDTEVGSATTTSYTDTAVTPNTAYEYYVTAYDEDGDVSSPSNTEDIQTAADSEPPTTPQDLTVTGTTVSTASLSWQASTDPLGIPIGGYTVYRDGTAVASTTSTTYTDSGLAPSTTYTYTVSAYDEFDTASPQSPPAYATTQANGPSTPTNLTSSNVTSSSLTLSWSASTEEGGTIAGYDVYRNEVKIATVTTTSYNDSGLAASTMYEYTVDAFDTSGNYSPQSSPLYVTTSGGGAGGGDALFGARADADGLADTVSGAETDVTNLEAQIGRTLAVDNQYADFESVATQIPQMEWDIAGGRTPLLSWKPDIPDGNPKCASASAIADGSYDTSTIIPAAQAIKALGSTVLIRFHYEMTNTPSYDCFYGQGVLETNPAEAGQEYIAAYQHIVNVFRDEGATNVEWVFAPGHTAFTDDTSNGFNNDNVWFLFYPGAQYVDWIAEDVYNNSSTVEDFNTDSDITGFYDQVQGLGKPIMFTETGAQASAEPVPDPQVTWIDSALDSIPSQFPDVRGFVYWDAVGGDKGQNPYEFDGDTTGTSKNDTEGGYAAFASMGTSSYFSATNPSNITYGGTLETSAPSTPTNLAGIASTTANAVALSWSPSVSTFNGTLFPAAAYQIFRNGVQVGTTTSSATTTASSPQPSFTDTTVAPNTIYSYTVDALNGLWNASSASKAVNVHTSNIQGIGPTVPQGLEVTGTTTSSISLAWDASTDQNGTVEGYNVFRNGTAIATTSQTAYTDTGLTSGTSYSYTVDAYDNNGVYSAQSGAVEGTTGGGGSVERLSVKGQQILDPNGNPIQLTGFVWGDMFNTSTSSPNDAADNASQGANVVRIMLRWWGQYGTDTYDGQTINIDSYDPNSPQTGYINPTNLSALDGYIQLAAQNHLWVDLAMESDCGSDARGKEENPNKTCGTAKDGTGDPNSFYNDPTMLAEFQDAWEYLASQYKDTPGIGMYEILSEPTFGCHDTQGCDYTWTRDFYSTLIGDIYPDIDPSTPFLIGADHTYQASTTPLDEVHIATTTPIIYTADMLEGGGSRDPQDVPDIFLPFMEQYDVPFYIQQVGVSSGDADATSAAETILSTLDAKNSEYNTTTPIGWSWWEYRAAGNNSTNNAVWYTDANGNWVEKPDWLGVIDQYFSGNTGNQCGDEPKQPQVPQFTLNLTLGSTGSEVTALQKALGVTPTGYYSALTEAAVEKFQSAHGIVYSGSPLTTGYGALGPKTREALNESGPQTGSGGGSTCGPTVPQGLEVTGTTTSSISLAWQASTDNEGSITGYNVFRNGTAIATTTTTAYTDTGLSEGTSYSYTVDAYDNLGNYSAQSGAVEGTTGGGGNMDSTFLGNYLPSGVTITQFESTIGHSIQIENQGESFGTDWGTDSKRAGEEPTDIKDGVIPMISLKLDGSLAGGASSCVTLQEIIDGDFDGTAAQDYGYTDKQGNFHPGLIEMAQAFASWKTPILIRFFKEFTDDQIDKCAYGVAKPADDPQVYGPLFVAAWQHVVNIFKENGATNVEWIWGPSAGLFANEDGSPDNVAWQYFYPGNNYVDWVSDDNYDKSNTTIEDFNADSSIIDWYSLIQQTGKPMMQAETGAGYNAGLQPNDPMNVWLSSAYAALTGATTTNPMPDIRAFLWWGASGTNDYVLQGAGLTTYADMAADSYFGAATSSISQYFSSTGSASGPSTPANLIGTPVGDAIDLSWSASTDNNGTISYYDIYRTLGATTTEIATTTSSSYTDSNVTNGTSYGYLIDAIDNNLNRSLQSTEIQVTAGGNSCNDGGKVYGGSQFTLNLTLGSTGSEVTALQKLLGVTQSGYYGALTEVAVEKFQSAHGIVYSGSPLTTGYGALGPKTREALNESGPQTGSGGGSTCGPTVPQGLEVTGTTTSSISLAWQASTDNEGSITGYNVFRNGTAIATTTTTAYTDTGLSEGTSYSYTVDAYDNLGNYSAQSGAVEGTTGGGGDGGTVLIGLHGSQSDIDAIEKDMGRPPAIQYAYYSISSNFSTSSSPAVQEIANGSIPMINWIPHEAGNTNSKDYCGGVTATNILSGMFDGPNINPYTGNQNPGFYAQAEEIKSLGVPVIVGWFGQMTDSIPDTCFYTTNVGDVSVAGPEYVAAYRHIVSIFKDVGATNVQFVWPPAASLMSKGSNTCDLNGQKNLPDWECFYPGNAWVDWIGNDHYNKSSSVSDYDQDSDIINWYNAVAPLGKPLMQRQTGAIATSTETPDPQSEWVTTAHTSINPSLASSTENTFPAIKVFSYNDSNSQANGQILQNLGSNKGLTDFIDLADDPYFGATSVNQYFSSTGGDPDNIGTPSNLNVTGETNSSISISWSPSTDEYPINGYDIFRDGEIIGEATTSTSYTDTGLSEGTTYSYTVEAYDENGYYSAQSSAVQQGTLGGNQCGGNNDNQGGSLFTQNLGLGSTGVQVTALQKLLGVTQSGYYGALTEAAVEKFQSAHGIISYGSPLTTGYGAAGPKTRTALEAACLLTQSTASSTVLTLLTNTTTTATTTVSTTTTTTKTDTTPPSIPQGLIASVISSGTPGVRLSWSPATDNVAVAGYYIYRSGSLLTSATTTSYIDTTMRSDSTYVYTVRAYDAAGNVSAASNGVSITAPYIPDTTPPSTPSNLTASVELKGGSGPGVGTNYVIVLSWSPATDNVGVAGYDIYRATGNTFATLTLLTSVSSLTYTDASVSPGTTYYYTVKAYDAAGNISGASNEASGSF